MSLSGPPVFHYVSYTNGRLNPNLYEEGKVCVSLLGTWSGEGSEEWSSQSTLLQVRKLHSLFRIYSNDQREILVIVANLH